MMGINIPINPSLTDNNNNNNNTSSNDSSKNDDNFIDIFGETMHNIAEDNDIIINTPTVTNNLQVNNIFA